MQRRFSVKLQDEVANTLAAAIAGLFFGSLFHTCWG